MSNNHDGGLKAAETNRKRYGDDFYSRIGHKGGSTWTSKLKGFAANPELAKKAGRNGGTKTRRGLKWIEDVDSWHGRYIVKATGEEVVVRYNQEIKP